MSQHWSRQRPSEVDERASRRGFTLVELLISLAIIGILAAIAVPIYNGMQRKARRNAFYADGRTLFSAFIEYHLDQDEYPPCCSPPEEAFDKTTLWPLTRYQYIRSPEGILGHLQDHAVTAYDSPDLPTTNHDFYAVLTHYRDPTLVLLVADTDQYPGFGGTELYGLYLVDGGDLIPIKDVK